MAKVSARSDKSYSARSPGSHVERSRCVRAHTCTKGEKEDDTARRRARKTKGKHAGQGRS